MSDVTLFLLTKEYTPNQYGVGVPSFTKTEVFAEIKDCTRYEIDVAGRMGHNPQYVFTVFKGDYQGEESCEYDGATYSIYRTYEKDKDYIELYVERKGGTNGEESDG